jgi:cbb3-type cytochrome oxidase maturation protein
MEDSLLILIPLSLLLVFVIAAIFWWSSRSGQFDDMEGPAWRVLMEDEDKPASPPLDAGQGEKTPTDR